MYTCCVSRRSVSLCLSVSHLSIIVQIISGHSVVLSVGLLFHTLVGQKCPHSTFFCSCTQAVRHGTRFRTLSFGFAYSSLDFLNNLLAAVYSFAGETWNSSRRTVNASAVT